jgi:hypothetical protein
MDRRQTFGTIGGFLTTLMVHRWLCRMIHSWRRCLNLLHRVVLGMKGWSSTLLLILMHMLFWVRRSGELVIGQDTWRWEPERHGCYSVRSAYRIIYNEQWQQAEQGRASSSGDISWKRIWRLCVPRHEGPSVLVAGDQWVPTGKRSPSQKTHWAYAKLRCLWCWGWINQTCPYGLHGGQVFLGANSDIDRCKATTSTPPYMSAWLDWPKLLFGEDHCDLSLQVCSMCVGSIHSRIGNQRGWMIAEAKIKFKNFTLNTKPN